MDRGKTRARAARRLLGLGGGVALVGVVGVAVISALPQPTFAVGAHPEPLVMMSTGHVTSRQAPASRRAPASRQAPASRRPVEVAVNAAVRREAKPLTEADRNRGFNECYLPDPVGLGPYAPYRKTKGRVLGRVAIPQKGGHTEDMGFDVVVHFHGGDPVRKQYVQVTAGAVFVAVDLGVGSGPYARAFVNKKRWPGLLSEIGRALRDHTGDERAHIRHLAISAWSAGYGAVNQILKKHGDEGIDAVVLLDGMHAGRNYRWPYRDGTLESLSADSIRPIFDFAARASRGEKTFVLTHSNVVPSGYASVRRSADLLLKELDLERSADRVEVGLLEKLTTVDHQGFHVWGYAGRYEEAHCSQVTLLGPIVRDLLEPQWQTPPMDRNVPNTPAPVLGNRRR